MRVRELILPLISSCYSITTFQMGSMDLRTIGFYSGSALLPCFSENAGRNVSLSVHAFTDALQYSTITAG